MSSSDNLPKSFLNSYSKQELIAIATTTLEKAKTKHQEARHWRNRCLTAEAELEALKGSRGNR